MKALHASWIIAALVVTGCDRESPRGGPGVSETTTTTTKKNGTTITTTKQDATNRDETFRVEVPSGGTNVTQGKRQEVTISLDRGDEFKQAVKLSFEAPQGLKVVPSSAAIKAGENKTNVFVEATDTAVVGRHTIMVTGTPDTGKSASVKMDIDVKKRD